MRLRFGKALWLVLLTLISVGASAQKGTIRGTVIDDEIGEPLIAVTVLIKGTLNGAVTDFDGKFEIKAEPGIYDIQASFVSFETLTITGLEVKSGQVTVIDQIRMKEDVEELEAVVVTADVVRTSESALLTVKRKSVNLIDGISTESFRKIGDSNAGEAAKRVTGVSVEGGKYVYVRGLGDRYTKTTLNGMDIPGLDPDRNSIQIDVFPTNLIDNMLILKTFTPDLPADFTGGIVNIETKDFPDEKVLDVSLGIDFNPSMHFNNDYLTYEGGRTDFLGFDDGTRALPSGDLTNVPNPANPAIPQQEVDDFLSQFSPTSGATNQTSFMNYNLGFTLADQFQMANGNKIGYLFTGNYRNNTHLYDDAFFGEYQNNQNDADEVEFQRSFTTDGILSENNVLLSGLVGVAYKTDNSKYRLTAMRLQNGESRAGQFDLVDDQEAVGNSGYFGKSDNLEFNQREISNIFLNGEHHLGANTWVIDWRLSSTWSGQEDPDIRKTAFTGRFGSDEYFFNNGAAGFPTRLWRELDEINIGGKVDITKDLDLFGRDAKLKFGASHTFKERDYRIVDFQVNFLRGEQPQVNGDASLVWTNQTVFPAGSIYLVSGVSDPNPNQYNSTVDNTGIYISAEFSPTERLKGIFGARAENFVQRHTGRDQLETRVLDNEKVLDALDFFPSANLIYAISDRQNFRLSFSKTIARPSFKELSFAQILDPVSSRIFNGGLFPIDDWDGNLVETHIANFDARWEIFMEGGQTYSVSAFYKSFTDPIELVRIPQAQTNPEYQTRNVGDGRLYGLEFELRKALNFISPEFSVNGNVTLVESFIRMSATELRTRENNARTGEVIDDERSMAGQSPWVVNAGLSYNNLKNGLDAGLFYNVKGETLLIIGGGIEPDVFTQPFHSLNFNLNKSFGVNEQWAVNFSVSNILNDKMEQFYRRSFSNAENVNLDGSSEVFQQFSPNVSFGAGIKYSL